MTNKSYSQSYPHYPQGDVDKIKIKNDIHNVKKLT